MNTLRFFLVLIFSAAVAAAQTQKVEQVIATKRVTSDIVVPSGKNFVVEAGATIQVSSGATKIGLGGDVVGPSSSSSGQLSVFSDGTGKLIGTFSGTGVVVAASGVPTATLTPGIQQALLSEIASPSTPGTAVVSLYAKADGTIYSKDDAGVERSNAGLIGWRSPKSATYTVAATDRGALIDCTSGTFSVNLTAAATLGAGFSVAIYNSGSGTITIDPNASETIRDASSSATTKTLAQGAGYILMCDGSGWLAVAGTGSGGGGGSTGTVTFSTNTITGTTSGNTVLTSGVTDADVRLVPNGNGWVVADPRFAIESIPNGGSGLYMRGNVGGSGKIYISGDTGDLSRGSNVGARIGFMDDGGYGAVILFETKNGTGSGTATVERARITSGSSGGNLLVGTTDQSGISASGGLKVATNAVLPGIVHGAVNKTSNYTLTGSDTSVYADTTSNNITITLPASPANGQIFIVKKINAANTLTVARNGNNIDGSAADLTTSTNNTVYRLQFLSGNGWQQF